MRQLWATAITSPFYNGPIRLYSATAVKLELLFRLANTRYDCICKLSSLNHLSTGVIEAIVVIYRLV